MANNPFTIDVPQINPLQDLMGGYQFTNGMMRDQRLQSSRQAAQGSIASGDYQGAISALLSGGDTQSAGAVANLLAHKDQVAYQQQQLGMQGQQIAESARHDKALEGQSGAQLAATKSYQDATLAETRRQHDFEAGKPVLMGNDPTTMMPMYGIRDATAPGGFKPVDFSAMRPAGSVNTAGLSGEAFLKALPPQQAALIKGIADYTIDPRTATSLRGGHREAIMSQVAQYDPTYNGATYPARARAVQAFSTGPQGNAMRSFDVAIDHLDTVGQLANALKNGDVNAVNAIGNKFKEQFGYAAPTDFNAAKSIVGAEVAKAIVGSGNALADREELRSALNNARSPEQLAGVIDTYKRLMAGQLKGLRKQYEDTTGMKNFNSRLRPGTISALQMAQDQPGSSQPPAPNGVVSGVTPSGVTWSVK